MPTTSQPILSYSAGATVPATPLPQSMATLSGRRQRNVTDDALDVVLDQVAAVGGALAGGEMALFDAVPQRLDGALGERPATDHHLQAVVFGEGCVIR